jgi:hypothetical protein
MAQGEQEPWNLNNLPVNPRSMLRHFNEDISGVKVPWVYAGMLFSSFCWHIEDHWTYSINYLHQGAPKLWYGVPRSSADSLEAAMRADAPELFDAQPDLLHQLVTLASPVALRLRGVPVYRQHQRAGEFIVTFPRAYHAGFNMGFNVAEACNFAPADWLHLGRECVARYRQVRRRPVFSHDELVVTLARSAQEKPSGLDVASAARVLVELELAMAAEAAAAKKVGLPSPDGLVFEALGELEDDERACRFCNATLFLSARRCNCARPFACLSHPKDVVTQVSKQLSDAEQADCECAAEQVELLCGVEWSELTTLCACLRERVHGFHGWASAIRPWLCEAAWAGLSRAANRLCLHRQPGKASQVSPANVASVSEDDWLLPLTAWREDDDEDDFAMLLEEEEEDEREAGSPGSQPNRGNRPPRTRAGGQGDTDASTEAETEQRGQARNGALGAKTGAPGPPLHELLRGRGIGNGTASLEKAEAHLAEADVAWLDDPIGLALKSLVKHARRLEDQLADLAKRVRRVEEERNGEEPDDTPADEARTEPSGGGSRRDSEGSDSAPLPKRARRKGKPRSRRPRRRVIERLLAEADPCKLGLVLPSASPLRLMMTKMGSEQREALAPLQQPGLSTVECNAVEERLKTIAVINGDARRHLEVARDALNWLQDSEQILLQLRGSKVTDEEDEGDVEEASGLPQDSRYPTLLALQNHIALAPAGAELEATRIHPSVIAKIDEAEAALRAAVADAQRWKALAETILQGTPDLDALEALLSTAPSVRMDEHGKARQLLLRAKAWVEAAGRMLLQEPPSRGETPDPASDDEGRGDAGRVSAEATDVDSALWDSGSVRLKADLSESEVRRMIETAQALPVKLVKQQRLLESALTPVDTWRDKLSHTFCGGGRGATREAELCKVLDHASRELPLEELASIRVKFKERAEKPKARYCHCGARGERGGLMVECNACCHWYHARCEKLLPSRLPLRFVCSVCAPGRRPTLDALQGLIKEGCTLPVNVDEVAQLQALVERGKAWEAQARHILKHPSGAPENKSDEAGALLAQADRLCLSLDEKLFRKLAAALGFMEESDESETESVTEVETGGALGAGAGGGVMRSFAS